jgi:hypothetical protein
MIIVNNDIMVMVLLFYYVMVIYREVIFIGYFMGNLYNDMFINLYVKLRWWVLVYVY